MGRFDPDPRTRRLYSDFEGMRILQQESSIFKFAFSGEPPDWYLVTFQGRGTAIREEGGPVELTGEHQVEIVLGTEYPRSQPYLRWKTPIFHPNISVSGAVCLGGYSSYWTPGLSLDRLCEMLWDMLRYANYDTESPYNVQAARWAKEQRVIPFPLDPRPLRDRKGQGSGSPQTEPISDPPAEGRSPGDQGEDIVFLD